MIVLYGLKSCDSCRKAARALDAAGREHRFIDIREDADLSVLAPRWLAAIGAEALVNTRSATWRGLPEAERARLNTDPAGLLIAHPALVKRPLIDDGAVISAGWTKDVAARLGAVFG
ncbi:MAG: ArsC family transcriptional regulator [Maricaulaceae bacterium]|nr:ArsC family transcriptional regulator [Maricaulaceae bacterium]